MVVLERLVQVVAFDKWSKLDKIDQKWNAFESRLGFPPKKRYQSIATTYDSSTIIIEREWGSLAEMEAAYEKQLQDPEYDDLLKDTAGVITSSRMELYTPLP